MVQATEAVVRHVKSIAELQNDSSRDAWVREVHVISSPGR